MRFLTRSLTALFLAALAVGLLAVAGGMVRDTLAERAESSARPRVSRERVFTTRVIALLPQTVAPELAVFGEIQSLRTLELRAPSASQVLELTPGFADGARVEAGQILIRLDPADAEAALELARSDLDRAEAEARDAARALELARLDRAEAQAQVDLRERALERRQTLSARGVGSASGVEEAEFAFASARAAYIARQQSEAQAEARVSQARSALERQRISLSEAERRVADTEIHATFGGVLSDTSAVVGGNVGMNERLARVIDPDALEVAFRVSTAQYLRLLDPDGGLVDAQAVVALELGGVEIETPAHLTRSSPSVGEGQTGRLIYASLDAPRGFRPGDFVTVRLTEPQLENVARVPSSAIDAQGAVLVLADEDRLETGRVDLIRRQGDAVLVRVPPELAGREIVAARTPLLGEGIRVRPQRDEGQDGQPTALSAAPETVELTPERRAALIAQVEANTHMPEGVRSRILAQLGQEQVPARLIERLENGGGRRGG